MTILNQMEVFPGMIEQENNRYGPFLATTTILMEAVKNGAGREGAYDAIKSHAVAAVKDLRSGAISQNDLVKRLGADKRLGLDEATIERLVKDAQGLTGMAQKQVEQFCERVHSEVAGFDEAKNYSPGAIL